jgi:hypothetical protein
MPPRKTVGPNERWNLYWVRSDGIEDCFVVARNSRSACSVEVHMNGFDFEEVSAERIGRIPPHVAEVYHASSEKEKHAWPWYAYGREILEALGAQFRSVEKREEMLLGHYVYDVPEYVPCSITRARNVGPNSMDELFDEIGRDHSDYDDEIWTGRDVHIATMLGMCLVRCHQIEDYISRSFILGISDKQKTKYKTVDDLKNGWKRKTLGNMLICIKEAWEIDPTLDAGLDLFKDMRNLLIHGLTTHEQYDITTEWGKMELIHFLRLFDIMSNVVRSAFRVSLMFSIAYAIEHFGLPDDFADFRLSDEHEEEAALFAALFSVKQ